ncbi:elongation factor G [Sphingobium chlorophenolicum]|uniref:Elongation factor G n=1 Tax=Sphingobium chlorophenolicum TaxID=46429 RepID=A0A081R8R5_SPHCR|nr:elongation factor G [Sphingobium chlorophenolicum]KEQ51588.1 Small GTP-binding protein [Sphingobium chlorophenolicum]
MSGCYTRAVALVGPAGAGKTSLAESMLFISGAVPRQGSVQAGSSAGDASPEARERGGSTELNLMHFEWMGDRFALIDVPGAPGFAADGSVALDMADLAIVVIDPDPERAALAQPVLRRLERAGIPHALFVNKIDQARGSIEDLLTALAPMSAAALVARQIPIRAGERVAGFVDLALERAYHYEPGRKSQQVALAPHVKDEESAARFHMLEQLADHDDLLLEQLLSDEQPSLDSVFADLARETASGLIVPVLFGSASNGFGIRRLLKMLRHDTPAPERTAERLSIRGEAAQIFKISHAATVGRLALTRIFGGTLADGAEMVDGTGRALRPGGLFAVQGAATAKISSAEPGAIVGIAKMEGVQAGDVIGMGAKVPATGYAVERAAANCALAIAAKDHKDEVRLSTALNRLAEEDAGLHWDQDEGSRETLLHGMGEEHFAVALDRLKRRYGVAVSVRAPTIAYRESVRKAVTQRGRHKKQSGGHGQFGDVVLDVRPLERGEGIRFEERITGGAVPRQYIPAVEKGVMDAVAKGPLGFAVVDVSAALVDGSFHSVDSSELAFRTAGRMAMADALAAASPYLLEPVAHVTIMSPGAATSRITSAVASRRGQMLRMTPLEGWFHWDVVEVLLPEAGLQGLEAEIRSMSQGMAHYAARFDHLAEVNAKLADSIVHRAKELA